MKINEWTPHGTDQVHSLVQSECNEEIVNHGNVKFSGTGSALKSSNLNSNQDLTSVGYN